MDVRQKAAGQLDEQERVKFDDCLRRLQAAKGSWARLALPEKIYLLVQMRQNLAAQAENWVVLANRERQIAPHSPWAAEEWYEIFAVARALHAYAHTLNRLAQNQSIAPKKVWTRPNGQVVAQVFPTDAYDWLLFNGMTNEVWQQPEVTEQTLPETMGSFYRQARPTGAVALVLGAGNVNSIPPLDVLDRLFVHGRVVLLKLSPVNAYLQAVLEAVFAPLISRGFLAIVSGNGTLGSYLAHHPDVEVVHLTGSANTYRAIVYGQGGNGQNGRPQEALLRKPITAELGGVTPVVVLPGRWTAADIQFQAENIATMKLYNSGYNCIAAQLLVLPEKWPQRQALLAAIQQVMRRLPPQPAYFPGAAERQQAAQQACPEAMLLGGEVPRTLIPGLTEPQAARHCLQNEFFGPVLAVATLPGDTAVSFLQNAVTFCNQSVAGSLGVDLIVPPDVLQRERPAVETAVAELKYGSVGLNSWCGVAFRIVQCPWGAYQDPEAEELGSGQGVVHNTLLFDKPQKTVVRGRFRPFPRSWRHGDPTLLPKPPWFVTHRQRILTARQVAQFAINPSLMRLPGIFAAALRG